MRASSLHLLLASLRCMLSIISSVGNHQLGKADQRSLQTRHVTIVKFESDEVLTRLVEVLSMSNDSIIISALSILKKLAKLSRKDSFLIDNNTELAVALRNRLLGFLKQSTNPGDIELLTLQLIVRWMERSGAQFMFEAGFSSFF